MANDDGGTASVASATNSGAGTAPAIPDAALSRLGQLPVTPSDEDVEAMVRKLGAPIFDDAGAD